MAVACSLVLCVQREHHSRPSAVCWSVPADVHRTSIAPRVRPRGALHLPPPGPHVSRLQWLSTWGSVAPKKGTQEKCHGSRDKWLQQQKRDFAQMLIFFSNLAYQPWTFSFQESDKGKSFFGWIAHNNKGLQVVALKHMSMMSVMWDIVLFSF